MALNIKNLYPFEHPQSTSSLGELIDKISRPSTSAVYLKTDLKKDETFKRNEDLYLKVFLRHLQKMKQIKKQLIYFFYRFSQLNYVLTFL